MTSQAVPTTDTLHSHAWTVVHRTVFPVGDDSALLPLYIDPGSGVPDAAIANLPRQQSQLFSVLREAIHAEVSTVHPSGFTWTRHAASLAAETRVSFATYFNAFPAGYWQEHTDVETVRLEVSVAGAAQVDLLRSNSRGKYVRVDSRPLRDETTTFDIPLKSFGDGGWLWFDMEAIDGPAALRSAQWSVPTASAHRGPTALTVAIASYNMPQACLDQIRRFSEQPDVMDVVRQLVIVDQGTRRLRDAEGFEQAASLLPGRLTVIEQANLGGSGGFSRGMAEMLADPESAAVLLLDDDAEAEPESILRAARFNDFVRDPLIIGGHMLNANDRTVLHSFGETINFDSFWWEAVDETLSSLDFRKKGIRSTTALSRRLDVPYNGWWMCLIPRTIVETVGLSLPFFIKWDDAEYCLRAGEAGFGTVSLPGMAAWHVPWDEKDDGLDWQAYFHQRNRWVTALLHSPRPRGGSLVRKSFASDLKHLLSMQYTASVLRGNALEDVLRGPDHMRGTLADSAAKARQIASTMSDGALITRRADYPRIDSRGPRAAWSRPPANRFWFAAGAVVGIVHQIRSVRAHSPQERVRANEAKWWRLAGLDEAVVSNAGGSGVWLYRRDRRLYWSEFARSLRSHARLWISWRRLSQAYRREAATLASLQEWDTIFRS